jgi:hypothetical protein
VSTNAARSYFFHYVNVDPGVTDALMITDVYLPLR